MSRPMVRFAAGYFLALLVVVITWAVGIPRFASPDEPAHIYKAYGTAHGELLGSPAGPEFSNLPANLREFDGPDSLGPPSPSCYNGLPDVPASCVSPTSPHLISSAARYPPWYYGLVGVPVAVSGQSDKVLPYRLVSAVLCVALLALAMIVAKRGLRDEVVALQLAAFTPMALFLMASVNPNAIEVAVFVAIWACLSRVATDARLPLRLLILASWLSAAVVLMRPISIVWMAGTVVVAVIAASPQRRRELLSRRSLAWAVGPTALALVGSWLWLVYSRMEIKDERLTNTLDLAAALRRSVHNWGDYLRQTIGVLGWLDTTLPSFVYAAWFVALGLVAVIHLRSATRRTFVALVMLVAVWLALPLIINGFTNSRAGLTYQGRYSLPIFVGVAFLPMFNDRSKLRAPRLAQRPLVGAVLALVVVAEVGAFWEMLRRYTVGADGKIVLTGNLPWTPSITPMLLVALNAAAMVAVAWSAWRPWGQVEAATGEWHGEGTERGADRRG
ncbi:MAG TPA: DUF2142 domain-containing protein [Ilumatobacteraceae bacterium]|nr:DUF2142 domain-containing protein [Ilumatobacteraceae bacterium]